MISDENITQGMLDFVMAHELGHQYLNHQGEVRDPETEAEAEAEAEADYAAYIILNKKKKKSAKEVIKYWKQRNGGTFKKYQEVQGEELEHKINKYL
jgi:Zn-dependent peptidase ImmA (M78 family)